MEGGHRQGPDRHFEAVAERRVEFGAQVVELPQVAEVVLGSGGRAGPSGHLHGQPRHDQAGAQPLVGLGHARRELSRLRQGFAHPSLDELPGERVDRLDAQGVGVHPVGARGDLRRQVAVPRGGHRARGGGGHVEVEDHGQRRGAGHRDLQPAAGHGSAETGVAVHGGRGRDDGVGLAEFARGQFDEVVDGPRAHSHAECPGFAQALADLLAVVVGGVEGRAAREDHRLGEAGPRPAQPFLDCGAGGRPGPLVGDEQSRPPAG